MDGRERERLHEALGGEKGMRVRDRAWLVCLVPGMETPRKAAARSLRKRARRARKWPRRHREGGLAVAVQDEPVFVHGTVAGVKCQTCSPALFSRRGPPARAAQACGTNFSASV